jgi:hypothetical protein
VSGTPGDGGTPGGSDSAPLIPESGTPGDGGNDAGSDAVLTAPKPGGVRRLLQQRQPQCYDSVTGLPKPSPCFKQQCFDLLAGIPTPSSRCFDEKTGLPLTGLSIVLTTVQRAIAKSTKLDLAQVRIGELVQREPRFKDAKGAALDPTKCAAAVRDPVQNPGGVSYSEACTSGIIVLFSVVYLQDETQDEAVLADISANFKEELAIVGFDDRLTTAMVVNTVGFTMDLLLPPRKVVDVGTRAPRPVAAPVYVAPVVAAVPVVPQAVLAPSPPPPSPHPPPERILPVVHIKQGVNDKRSGIEYGCLITETEKCNGNNNDRTEEEQEFWKVEHIIPMGGIPWRSTSSGPILASIKSRVYLKQTAFDEWWAEGKFIDGSDVSPYYATVGLRTRRIQL